MKNIGNRLSEDQLLNVNGGAYVDFEKIRKAAEKINGKNENGALSWHWGDDWDADPYWG